MLPKKTHIDDHILCNLYTILCLNDMCDVMNINNIQQHYHIITIKNQFFTILEQLIHYRQKIFI